MDIKRLCRFVDQLRAGSNAFYLSLTFGLMFGFLDMIVGNFSVRLGELFVVGWILYKFINIRQKIFLSGLQLGFFLILLVTLALWGDFSQSVWFFKLYLTVVFASLLLMRPHYDIAGFLMGLCLGYTLYSVLLVLSGNSYQAKYTSPHLAIYLLLFLVINSRCAKFLTALGVLFGVFVAIASNSRGQLMLGGSVLSYITCCFLALIGTRLRYILIRGTVLIPLIYVLGQLWFYFNLIRLPAADASTANAGDLERSILGIYSLVSIKENLFGQSIGKIEDEVSYMLGGFVERELATTSAHNVIEDSILYGGALGAIFGLITIYKLLDIVIYKSRMEDSSNNPGYAVSLIVIFFIFATTPLASLERIQLLASISLIGLINKDGYERK